MNVTVSRDWIIEQIALGYVGMTRIVGLQPHTRSCDAFSIGLFYGELTNLSLLAVYAGDFELVGRVNTVKQAVGDLFCSSHLWCSGVRA